MISISREYQKLRKSDFSVSMEEVKQPLSVFLYWCIPAILSVYFVKWLDGKGPANYLQTAIEQGVGPILWNTLACFGLILMSFSFAFAYFGESDRSFRFYPITFSSSFSSLQFYLK